MRNSIMLLALGIPLVGNGVADESTVEATRTVEDDTTTLSVTAGDTTKTKNITRSSTGINSHTVTGTDGSITASSIGNKEVFSIHYKDNSTSTTIDKTYDQSSGERTYYNENTGVTTTATFGSDTYNEDSHTGTYTEVVTRGDTSTTITKTTLYDPDTGYPTGDESFSNSLTGNTINISSPTAGTSTRSIESSTTGYWKNKK